MSLNQNQLASDMELIDVLNLFKKNLLLDLACHHIATVQSFNTEKQTVTATVNYKKTFMKLDQATGTYKRQLENYSILLDCPAVILGGGLFSLEFPIQKGDECIILFNDRDLDNWLDSGQVVAPATPRLHSFSDGVALVGLRSKPNRITGYDLTRAVLRYRGEGEAMVAVGEELIKISNEMHTLKTVLNGLIDAIGAMTVSGTAGGNPIVGGAVSGVASYKPTIAELLE